MEKEFRPINWIDLLRLMALSSILLYFGYTYTFVNMILIIVPAPLILIGYKYGYPYLAGSIGGLALFALAFLNDLRVLGFVVVIVGINAAALCFFMNERDYTYKILFLGTIVCTASIILFGPIMQVFMDVDLLDLIRQNMLDTIENRSNSILVSSEPMTEEQIELMLGMIPFMIVYLSAIFVAVNYYLSRRYLVNQGFTPYSIQPIEEFRLPDHILAGTTVVLLLVLLTGYMKIVDSTLLSQNAVYIFVCVFMFQGLAVIGHWLVKRGMQNPLKTMILIGVFLFFGPLLLGLIGWLDAVVDFRKMRPRKRE